MTKPGIEIGGLQMGSNIQGTQGNRSQSKNPFHALIMSNFSGNKKSEDKTVSNHFKPVQIDRDNFDELLEKIQPGLSLTIDGKYNFELRFKALEDFEPDALYNSLDIFAQLRSLRRRLSNQSTFSDAVQEINGENNSAQPGLATDDSGSENSGSEFNGSLLDNLLSETANRQETNQTSPGSDLVKNLIRDIIAPHIIPSADPKQKEYIASVDQSISDLMSAILHHPKFQALESAWRGLYFVIKRTKTDSDLKLFLLDISKNELIRTVDSDDEKNTLFYKNVIEPYTDISGAKPWSVLIGDYIIQDQAEDIFFLERMGKLAAHSNASFISGASSQLVSCESLTTTPDADDWQLNRDDNILKAWQFLRESAQAKHLALLFPGFLLRLPYGTKTRTIESFHYEEMPKSIHKNYLWGNAAYALLYLLTESYSLNKWQFQPGQINEISNLPVHFYDDEGETSNKPCAEILLTEKGGEQMVKHGVLPVWSVKNEDKIRIGPMISLHSEPQVIVGQWVC